ncbi:MAG: hypothetical protein RL226_1730 [Bacteroidota bacterium]
MVRFWLVILFLFGVSASSLATHNRAGEITYRHISGLTYEVTITTCTKTSVTADRPFLHINWGDDAPGANLDSLERTTIQFVGGQDAQINIYVGVHTYGGPGIYNLYVEDPNRNEGVLNIPNSVDQIFCITSQLVISPQAGINNSVVLLNPAKEQACLQRRWIHNPGAYDPDGDILVYSLVQCMGGDVNDDGIGCDPLPGYVYPDEVSPANDTFEIDPVTGDVVWESAQIVGEYNLAIKIEEWRWVGNQLVKVGHVIRDMQVNVQLCTNDPPELVVPADTCIDVNSNLLLTVSATDPNGDNMEFSAVGGPLTQVVNLATFTSNASGGTFSWTPRCQEIRLAPYSVMFKVEDENNQVSLTDIKTVNILVVGPRVENPLATAQGNSITVTWDVNTCLDVYNTAQIAQGRYDVYRRNNSFDFTPSQCEVGMPDYAGYQLVGSVQGLSNNTYLDTQGLFFGGTYCYRIVTVFPDGAESYVSEETCADIIKDQPVITNISVVETDAATGEMYIAWSPPTELDVLNFPGPYKYQLLHGEGYAGASNLIYESPQQVDLINEDTIFTHLSLNTLETPHNYRVVFWSGEDLVSSSANASSVFVELVPNDNEMGLVINHEVSWEVESYEIYRRGPADADYVLIDTVNEPFYLDTGLVNNVQYCWFVRTIGTYGVEGILDPLINDSQEICGKPYDRTPPCAPDLVVDGDCESETVSIVWTNPNFSCADDVMGYNLYYTPVEGEPFVLFATFDLATDTAFVFNENGEIGSIAGCYAVTALDSLLEQPDGSFARNESVLSESFCVDNCPLYLLPNIFTPNNDGINDTFHPFPYKFIEDVDFQVFNRWGGLVFRTADPDLGWNGTDAETGQICSDGTYFYTITVNTIRLSGIVPENFSGTIQLSDGANPVNE